MDDNLELLAEFLNTSHDHAVAYLHCLAAQAARELQMLPLPLPAFHLVPEGLTTTVKDTADRTISSKSSTEKAAISPEPLTNTHSAPKPRKETPPQTTVRAEIQEPTKNPTNTRRKEVPKAAPKAQVNPLQALLSAALQQMHEELGLSRTMFAMLSPDKSTLRARFVVESEKQLSLKGFVLSLTNPNLFKILLSKQQAISLNKGNAEKYLPMIPQSALEQINNSGFVSMSVFIKDKPVGIFYADNGISGPGVTKQQYDNFKVICQQTVQSITP
jgi:hypothetical protein